MCCLVLLLQGTLAALVDHDRIRIDTASLRWLLTHGNTLLDPELNESDVSDDCDPITHEDPSVSGGWAALSEHVQPPTVSVPRCLNHLHCRENWSYHDANTTFMFLCSQESVSSLFYRMFHCRKTRCSFVVATLMLIPTVKKAH